MMRFICMVFLWLLRLGSRSARLARRRNALNAVPIRRWKPSAIALFAAATAFGEVAVAADDIQTESATENGMPTYMAEGVVDAPPAEVWTLVSKCGGSL